MENGVRLGVIGPVWMREPMENCLEMFPSIVPVLRLSDELEDAAAFTEELADSVDALLFSGQLPFMVAKPVLPQGIPAAYIPLKGTGLYQALYKLRMKRPFTSISFDGIAPAYVERVRMELNEDFAYSIFEEKSVLEHAESIEHFHEQHFRNNKVSGAVTSMKIVSERLEAKGIPAVWLRPTAEDITVALERLLLATSQRKQRESQIVFGRIQTESGSHFVSELASEHQVQKRNVQLYRLLLDYAEQLEGYLTAVSESEYMFITNRGTFERVTEGYKNMPILGEVKRKLHLRISMGVGFGRSAIEAGTHARMALFQAREHGEPACFIVREDRTVFGPVEVAPPVTYPLKVTDRRMLEKAEKAGMNAAHLMKMIGLVRRKKANEFTAYELSQLLGVTPRSAHRIILSWLDANIIHIIGTEKLSSRGRPRQVFRLDLREEES
ncbi:MAG TPA: hypothetical protein VIG80_11790 [Bacillaceae bacterium]